MIKVVPMGFSRKRIGRDGKPRYTAYYLDIRGQERSAGTFSSKKDANDAWKKAEGAVSAGKPGDPSRGRQTFKVYVLEKWLPHHLLEPGVRSNYAGHIRNHLLPFFGPMKMRDIMPEHVRQWVTYMKDKGASAQTIKYSKGSVLNAIFTTSSSPTGRTGSTGARPGPRSTHTRTLSGSAGALRSRPRQAHPVELRPARGEVAASWGHRAVAAGEAVTA
jgi:hypothetical protein